MEEEDEMSLLDYRTPKGQLIKLLEQKIKKPEIDDSLSKVLDQFVQMTNDQTAFLENGIFQMNFAEDALLLQSCGLYYGKRVDKLWDELLQFHTRMVTYDETMVKNSGDRNIKEARKLELTKLEERLNRGKRKKIKLSEPEIEGPQNGCYVFDLDQNAGQELFDRANLLMDEAQEEDQALLPFDHNFEIFDDWTEIHRLDHLERKKRGSVLVSQYNKQKYRLKPYSIPNGEEMIYDLNDPEEFNTREGRLISVHHIRHLFDYNDRCLLPDEDFTIAKLRFAYVLKKKWLIENKINPDAPYETYKAEYEKYQRDYFENEKKKIQNMPQRNSEDLMKFYKALEKKEQLARQDQEKLRKLGVKDLPEISFESLILEPLKEGYQGDYDPYIPYDEETQPERSVQTPADGDHEVELSQLLSDLPKLPGSTAEAADNLRSDSGYFDGGFEADDESDHEDNTSPGTDTPFEFDKDNTENKGEELAEDSEIQKSITDLNNTDITNESCTQVAEDSVVTENLPDSRLDMEISGEANSMDETGTDKVSSSENALNTTGEDTLSSIEEDNPELVNENMAEEIHEFVKHGTVDENFNYAILEHSYFKKTDDMIMILYDKDKGADAESVNDDSQLDQIIDIGVSVEKEIRSKNKKEILNKNEGNAEKNKNKNEKNVISEDRKKRKLENSDANDPPPKRRKLTVKQIEKLKKSLIQPTKEIKWESFFSLNYQTEAGEGEVTRVDYESASEDEDEIDASALDKDTEDLNDTENQNEDPHDLNVSGYHSDHDGSHISDHDYCRPETPPLPLSQDSGIGAMDISTNSESIEAITPNNSVEFGNIDLIGELSKNTGISREELSSQQQVEQPQLTVYEKQREAVRERVADWKDYIMPKLKKLDEHDFDIHEYGSNIMNNMNVNETKPFGELVAGKSSAEVVRFFISSLQLANTMNVEICGAKKGELSNDTFELKLLSKERYHEHFQEYQAPSEESLRDKLKKVKQIRMQNKINGKPSPGKRKASSAISTNQSQQFKPQSIMKKSTETSSTSVNSISNSTSTSSPRKKIKILNYNVISPSNENTFDIDQMPTLEECMDFDFQQPSTSRQADISDRQNQLTTPVSEITSPISHTPSRMSIDSGFMPSCDEDFLDQFDQLQQTAETQLRSTPVKPRKILRVSFARNTNFNSC